MGTSFEDGTNVLDLVDGGIFLCLSIFLCNGDLGGGTVTSDVVNGGTVLCLSICLCDGGLGGGTVDA